MGTRRKYDEKFKLEAVKLARETGTKRAAECNLSRYSAIFSFQNYEFHSFLFAYF